MQVCMEELELFTRTANVMDVNFISALTLVLGRDVLRGHEYNQRLPEELRDTLEDPTVV